MLCSGKNYDGQSGRYIYALPLGSIKITHDAKTEEFKKGLKLISPNYYIDFLFTKKALENCINILQLAIG